MKSIDKEILLCNRCGNLQKLSCPTVQIGDTNILVIGESPAKNGWIKSKHAFYDINGNLQSTGKVLSRLLHLCSLDLSNIYFTECCKCLLANRKELRNCATNCKEFLLRQIEKLDIDIILPMGQYPTEIILNQKINKLGDYVGRHFEINLNNKKYIIIPIYHTSPINPLCYKGNEQIFKNLSTMIKSNKETIE